MALATARAEDARVVLVTSGEGEPMVDRLATELTQVGLVPVILVRPPSEDGAALDLDAARQQAEAVAAFEVVRTEALIRICVPVPGTVVPIQAELTWPSEDPVAEAMVGVQAVELLRAGLIEAKADTLGGRANRMSLAELALAVGRPAGGRVALQLGTQGAVGTLSSGPQASLSLGARVPVHGRVSATFEGQLPVLRARYEGPPGLVHLGVGRVSAGALLGLRDEGSGWVPDVGLSAGLAVIGFAYEPGPLFFGQDEQRFARPTAGVRAGLTTPRAGPLGARVDTRLDGSAPVAVRLEREPVGSWGPVSVGVGLSLDVLL